MPKLNPNKKVFSLCFVLHYNRTGPQTYTEVIITGLFLKKKKIIKKSLECGFKEETERQQQKNKDVTLSTAEKLSDIEHFGTGRCTDNTICSQLAFSALSSYVWSTGQ